MKKRNHYSIDFQKAVTREILEYGHGGHTTICARLNLPSSTVSRWVKRWHNEVEGDEKKHEKKEEEKADAEVINRAIEATAPAAPSNSKISAALYVIEYLAKANGLDIQHMVNEIRENLAKIEK